MKNSLSKTSVLVAALMLPIHVNADVKGMYVHPNGNVGVGVLNPTNGALEVKAPSVGSYSVYAHGGVFAGSYCNSSDIRIKNNMSMSDSEQDLSIVRSIEITDYQYSDPKLSGDYVKKLIGQQLYQVYPQAVKLDKGIINDIMTTGLMAGGYITLPEHSVQKGDTISLRIPDRSDQSYEVISTSVDGIQIQEDYNGEVMVLGREVDDFHYVDYDAVSMLSVSALQALADKADTQKQQIDFLIEENKLLKTNFNLLLSHICQGNSDAVICQ